MNKNKNINSNLVSLTVLLTVLFLITFFILRVNVRSANISESNVFTMINKIRKDANLNELKVNNTLQIAAKTKAVDIKAYKYFSHNSPNNIKWNDFITNQGYQYIVAGENLARGYYTPEDLVQDWMNSKTHKENIIFRDYTETGIAIIDTDNMGLIVVQMFAKPITF